MLTSNIPKGLTEDDDRTGDECASYILQTFWRPNYLLNYLFTNKSNLVGKKWEGEAKSALAIELENQFCSQLRKRGYFGIKLKLLALENQHLKFSSDQFKIINMRTDGRTNERKTDEYDGRKMRFLLANTQKRRTVA